jgi:hypothetical protein
MTVARSANRLWAIQPTGHESTDFKKVMVVRVKIYLYIDICGPGTVTSKNTNARKTLP